MNMIDTCLTSPAPLAGPAWRRVVRLQPRVLEPRVPGARRDLPLWALLTPDPSVPSELQLTYALRWRAPLTVTVGLIATTDGDGAGAEALASHPAEASADMLRRAVALALPGFAVADPSPGRPPAFFVALQPPAADVVAAAGAMDEPDAALPGPRALDQVSPGRLFLPAPAPLRLDLDAALEALVRLGVALRPHAVATARAARGRRPCERSRWPDTASPHGSSGPSPCRSPMPARSTPSPASTPWPTRPGPTESRRAWPSSISPIRRSPPWPPPCCSVPAPPRPRPGGTNSGRTCFPQETKPAVTPEPGAGQAVATAHSLARSRPAQGPRLHLGRDEAGGRVAIALSDLAQHLYVLGATGVGKTTLLSALIRQDIAAGCPVFLVDPVVSRIWWKFCGDGLRAF